MSGPSPAGGSIRALTRAEGAALRDHLLRLSPIDRRTRFLHAVNDAFLDMHARRIGQPGYLVSGWFVDGALRGVLEVSTVDGDDAEAALSVEAGWRNRGVGRALLRHGIRQARRAGCGKLMVVTTGDNHSMIRVARTLGARLRFDRGEVVGEIDAPPQTMAEMCFDLVADQADFGTAVARAWWAAMDVWVRPAARRG